MEYIVLHLVCAIISILIENLDCGCNVSLALLYVLTGPLGLVSKLLFILFSKIL